jgi:hypothetical protein
LGLDWEWEFIDGGYVKAHQHNVGAADQEKQVKSRVGHTTKIHLIVDGYGLPVEFKITNGEINDCSAIPKIRRTR